MSEEILQIDGLLQLESKRGVEEDLTHFEFRKLHIYCNGEIQEQFAATDNEFGTQLYCATCDISSAVE